METQRLTRDDFRALWLRRRRAFHLEMRDSYGVEDEEGPFRRWLLGETDDYQWHQSWLSFARMSTRRGTIIQRARIVTEPLSDYIKWAMTIDPQNIEAGEDIRYLPRHQAADLHLPEEDYWLLDEDTLVLSLFMPDGSSGGFGLVSDPGLLEECRTARDQVWARAIPYALYVA
ncbi:DUF6879 family protein [Nonomuraea sp. NPDC001699]